MADRRLLSPELSGAQSERDSGVLALEPLESRRLLNGSDGIAPGLVEAAEGDRDDLDEEGGGKDDLLPELRWVQPISARHKEGGRVLADDGGTSRLK